ncbi:uncharacterized protein LOC134195227 [Corticium candelabrum]|uniref:uncharacterized protein LOC134195227 n=1 Tax=Corticium candelabrum TaxID=121492 RepID=UPI002E25D6CB|nr:uncharacterized protein LOC134195227 [Corticium candelabrum]
MQQLKQSMQTLFVCMNVNESCLLQLKSLLTVLNSHNVNADVLVSTRFNAVQMELAKESHYALFTLHHLLPPEIECLFSGSKLMQAASSSSTSKYHRYITCMLSHAATARLTQCYCSQTKTDLNSLLPKLQCVWDKLEAEMKECEDTSTNKGIVESIDYRLGLQSILHLILDKVSNNSKLVLELACVTGTVCGLSAKILAAAVQPFFTATETDILESVTKLSSFGIIEIERWEENIPVVFVPQTLQEIVVSILKSQMLSTFSQIILHMANALSDKLPVDKASLYTYTDLVLFPHAVAVTHHCISVNSNSVASPSLLNLLMFTRDLYLSMDMPCEARKCSEALLMRQRLLPDNMFAIQ